MPDPGHADQLSWNRNWVRISGAEVPSTPISRSIGPSRSGRASLSGLAAKRRRTRGAAAVTAATTGAGRNSRNASLARMVKVAFERGEVQVGGRAAAAPPARRGSAHGPDRAVRPRAGVGTSPRPARTSSGSPVAERSRVERPAHGRGAQAEATGGAGDAAFGQQASSAASRFRSTSSMTGAYRLLRRSVGRNYTLRPMRLAPGRGAHAHSRAVEGDRTMTDRPIDHATGTILLDRRLARPRPRHGGRVPEERLERRRHGPRRRRGPSCTIWRTTFAGRRRDRDVWTSASRIRSRRCATAWRAGCSTCCSSMPASPNDPTETIGDVTTDEFVRVMVTNALSPMRVIESLEPLVAADGPDRRDVVRAGQHRQQRDRAARGLSRQQGGAEHVHAQLRRPPRRDAARHGGDGARLGPHRAGRAGCARSASRRACRTW